MPTHADADRRRADNKVYDGTCAGDAVNAARWAAWSAAQTLLVGNAGGTLRHQGCRQRQDGDRRRPDAGQRHNGGLASNYRIAPSATTHRRYHAEDAHARPTFSAANKVYDGTTAASVTLGALSGLVGSETLGTRPSGNFDTKDAGNGKTVTVGGDAGRRQQRRAGRQLPARPGSATTTADITRRQLTAARSARPNKVYDGTTIASVTLAGGLSNLVGNETLNVDSRAATSTTSNVGNAKPVTRRRRAGRRRQRRAARATTWRRLRRQPGPTITPATLIYIADPASKRDRRARCHRCQRQRQRLRRRRNARPTRPAARLPFMTPATAASPAGQYAINGSRPGGGNYRFVQAPAMRPR